MAIRIGYDLGAKHDCFGVAVSHLVFRGVGIEYTKRSLH